MRGPAVQRPAPAYPGTARRRRGGRTGCLVLVAVVILVIVIMMFTLLSLFNPDHPSAGGALWRSGLMGWQEVLDWQGSLPNGPGIGDGGLSDRPGFGDGGLLDRSGVLTMAAKFGAAGVLTMAENFRAFVGIH